VSSPAVFYFDLASPLAYLAAERLPRVFADVPVTWQPVLARELPDATTADMSEVERLAFEHDLQPLRWPHPYPFDSTLAMRAATYAASIGRAVAFAQAAFRQAYAGGRSLAEVDTVLIAAAACEMHPTAVLTAAELRSTRERLTAATAAAVELGVSDVPALRIEGSVLVGARALERVVDA